MIAFQDPTDSLGQLPIAGSTFAASVDGLFYFVYGVCIFFFLLIVGVLGWSVVKYRRKTIDQPPASTVTHNTTLEVVWTVIPLIIVMVIFVWGWKGSLDMNVAPADAKIYKVVAKRWNWTFTYPGDPVTSVNDLWVVFDQPVTLQMSSLDVLHSFNVPAFRVKRDVVPGRVNNTWFQPNRLGDFNLFCTEYCGEGHSKMIGKVHVVTAEEFAKRPWDDWDDTDLVGSGERVYSRNCFVCHSVDGSPKVGPSFKGLWGREEKAEVHPDGKRTANPEIITVKVDEEYFRESVRKPNDKIAVAPAGQAPYPFGGMTVFGESLLSERELGGLIEYVKSLADEPPK